MPSSEPITRIRAGLSIVAGMAATLVVAALLPGTASGAAGHASAKPTTVNVTLGKPSAYRVEISPKKAFAGEVVFKVKNAGKIPYRFMVCTDAATKASMRAAKCTGRTTKLLKPGKSTSLKVALPAKGSYEYLVTTPPKAVTPSKSIKGRIHVATAPKAKAPAKKATKPKAAAGSASLAAGEKIFKTKCGSCHTLAEANTHGGVGPNLDQLAPSQGTVANQVKSGGTFMPAFGTVLTSAQIKEVAAFVYHATHK